MPVITTNLWKAEPNTKVPGLSHYFSYRITGANLAANGTTVFNLPSNYVSPGQLSPTTGVPSSYAPTFTNPDVNSEPQYAGAVFVPTHFMVRNPSGPFVSSGASAAGTVRISLFNPNVSTVSDLTGAVTRTPGSANAANNLNTYSSFLFTASATGNSFWTSEASWQATVSASNTFTGTEALGAIPTLTVPPQVAETSASYPGEALTQVKFSLGDSLAVSVTVASFAAGGTLTPSTSAAFTVDAMGYWLQGI